MDREAECRRIWLDAETERLIAEHDGNARAAVMTLIAAMAYQEAEIERLTAGLSRLSKGYTYGRYFPAERLSANNNKTP